LDSSDKEFPPTHIKSKSTHNSFDSSLIFKSKNIKNRVNTVLPNCLIKNKKQFQTLDYSMNIRKIQKISLYKSWKTLNRAKKIIEIHRNPNDMCNITISVIDPISAFAFNIPFTCIAIIS
jgi:HJR/Mrr/RecB family endonuclease